MTAALAAGAILILLGFATKVRDAERRRTRQLHEEHRRAQIHPSTRPINRSHRP